MQLQPLLWNYIFQILGLLLCCFMFPRKFFPWHSSHILTELKKNKYCFIFCVVDLIQLLLAVRNQDGKDNQLDLKTWCFWDCERLFLYNTFARPRKLLDIPMWHLCVAIRYSECLTVIQLKSTVKLYHIACVSLNFQETHFL